MGVTNDPIASGHKRPIVKLGQLTRRDRSVRRIVQDWRRLTAGHAACATIVACSGGADSAALALALVVGKVDIQGLAHIVHDLRSPIEATADSEAVKALAGRLKLPFFERSVRTDGSTAPPNVEAAARTVRYAALAAICRESGAAFVATAHHANDQLETIIMALVRGAGPDGLRGIAPSMALPDGPIVIRPMLHVTREDAERICTLAEHRWQTDQTNLDTTRLRSALRHGALSQLLELRPDAPKHATRSAELLRDASQLIHQRAHEVFGDAMSWPRNALRDELAVVLGAGFRAAALRLTDGLHADALTTAAIEPAIRAVRDDSTEPREFHWAARLTLGVTANEVTLTRAESAV